MASELTAEEIYALFCVRGWCSDDHPDKDRHIRKIEQRLKGRWHVDWDEGRWKKAGTNTNWERRVP